jgi:hypothetical protein
MEVSTYIKDLCERQALAFILSEWDTKLTYDQVIEILEQDDWESNGDVMVWEQFEDCSDIPEQIESLRQMFEEVAEAALEQTK